MSGWGHSRPGPTSSRPANVCFSSLIGRLRSSAFETIHHHSFDVARGLMLLSGIGGKALPSWDSRTRWNNLCRGLYR